MLFEPAPGIAKGIKDFFKDANSYNVSTGLIGGFVLSLVTVPLVITAGKSANLPPNVIASWLFSVYFFGGILGIVLSLWYKKPICGAWSIPGIFAIAAVLPNFTMNQAVGAFLIAGLIVLVLGLTGWVKKAVSYLPLPIMMAMIAGVLFKFGMAIIDSFKTAPLLALIGFIGYFLCKKFLKKVPPVLGTFVFGFIAAAVMGQLNLTNFEFGLARPMFFTPEFNAMSMISIAIPLAALVIGAENMQATGVLMAEKYDPPVNTMTILSGIGGLITPWFGGHNANIAGPLTAFNTGPDAGPKEGRYVAAVLGDLVFGLFGVFAITAMSLIGFLPKPLMDLLVGLVMVGIISGALISAWETKKFVFGTFASFIIAMSGITVLQIGAAFWALVIGAVVSLLLEPQDFKSMNNGGASEASSDVSI
jgi:benzoate membrane transport protein